MIGRSGEDSVLVRQSVLICYLIQAMFVVGGVGLALL